MLLLQTLTTKKIAFKTYTVPVLYYTGITCIIVELLYYAVTNTAINDLNVTCFLFSTIIGIYY